MKSAKALLERIYTDEVFAQNIATDLFPVSITRKQGEFLACLVDTYKPKVLIELGFRYGVSSLWIQSARLVPKTHIIVDPFHHEPVPPNMTLIDTYIKKQKGIVFEERLMSQEYLATFFIARKKADMIFVDASQWFDSVMTDMFYISRVLKIQGIVIIRNLYNRPVRKAVMFYLRNLSYVIDGTPAWKNWIVKYVPIIGEVVLRIEQRRIGLCVLRLTGKDERISNHLWRHFISF